ncbi:DUF6319 family protein [Gordonia sp. CPCC 206044]|uniref:DUF6319 family protein n=1 Tax=Gordonia sp. CPCC 206044 TaxID=3140793 RepID=UPI003AF406DF
MCDHVGVNTRRTVGLTPDDLEALSAGLAAGKRVTVYLREPMPSLDLESGTSARAVSIEGSTVTVRPKGVDDQLPFEADELQRTRVTAPTAAPARRDRAKSPNTPTSPVESAKPVAVQPKPKEHPSDPPPAQPKPAPVKTSRRAKSAPAAVSVTITAGGDASTWSVSVSHGAKRHGKPTEVSADRVATAMRELGDDAAITAVDGAITAAREAAQQRIDELNLELETARAALANLDGSGHS